MRIKPGSYSTDIGYIRYNMTNDVAYDQKS